MDVFTLSEHEKMVTRISEAYAKRGFAVQTRGNNLPYGSKREEAIYRPDLIVRDPKDKQIHWIVEVETGEAGKAVVGAALLADICIELETQKGHQQVKPNLLFVFYRPSTKLQLAEKRLRQLVGRSRTNYLAKIEPVTMRRALDIIASA
jgi:hypothetical protein